jgi:hypothetical protein
MNDNKTLVVDIDRKRLIDGFLVLPLITGVFVFVFYLDKSIIYYLFGYYVHFIIQGFIATFIILFVACFIFNLWIIFDKSPVIIIDEKGIWFKEHGLVNWTEIEHIDIYALGNTPMEVIGVRLKDIDRISKQSRWPGKLRLFWSKLFKHNAHIDLSNLNISNEKIIEFAKQFILIENSEE